MHDLTEYTRSIEIGGGLFQALAIDPDTSKPIFHIYEEPTLAASEVVFSRICEKLGLPCVKADFAANWARHLPVKEVSASEYPLTGVYLETWLENGESVESLTNYDDIEALHILSEICQEPYWSDSRAGFVVSDPEPHFIKANNGGMFFAISNHLPDFDSIESGVSSPIARFLPPTVWEIFQVAMAHKRGKHIVGALAALTNDDLFALLDMPEGEPWDKAREHILSRLSAARNACIEAAEMIEETEHEDSVEP